MRVAIAYFANKNETFINIVKGLEKGIIHQGHHVDLIDLKNTSARLSMYKYFILCCNCISIIGGKIPEVFRNKIKQAGIITGSYCSVFVDKKLGANKTLDNLMKLAEKEGLIICSSQVIPTNNDAAALEIGKNIHIYN